MSNFSNDELRLLCCIPGLMARAPLMAKGRNRISILADIQAGVEEMMYGTKAFPGNGLIRSTSAETLQGNRNAQEFWGAGVAVEELLAESGAQTKPEKLEAIYDYVRQASAILESKADPVEAGEYRKWVYGIAETVAMNTVERKLFRPAGTDGINYGEREVLNRLASALGVAVPETV